MNVHELCKNYKSEFIFGLVLLAGVVLSYFLAQYIPLKLYGQLSMVVNGCIATVSLASAWIMAQSPAIPMNKVPAGRSCNRPRIVVFGSGARSMIASLPALMPPAVQISTCAASGGQTSNVVTGGGRIVAISATGAA